MKCAVQEALEEDKGYIRRNSGAVLPRDRSVSVRTGGMSGICVKIFQVHTHLKRKKEVRENRLEKIAKCC